MGEACLLAAREDLRPCAFSASRARQGRRPTAVSTSRASSSRSRSGRDGNHNPHASLRVALGTLRRKKGFATFGDAHPTRGKATPAARGKWCFLPLPESPVEHTG